MGAFSRTSTNLVVNRNWRDQSSKYSYFDITITLSTQGSMTTNVIAAAQLNLAFVIGCTNGIKSDDSVILPCSPSYARTHLVFGGGAANVVADYTGTFRLIVWGPSA